MVADPSLSGGYLLDPWKSMMTIPQVHPWLSRFLPWFWAPLSARFDTCLIPDRAPPLWWLWYCGISPKSVRSSFQGLGLVWVCNFLVLVWCSELKVNGPYVSTLDWPHPPWDQALIASPWSNTHATLEFLYAQAILTHLFYQRFSCWVPWCDWFAPWLQQPGWNSCAVLRGSTSTAFFRVVSSEGCLEIAVVLIYIFYCCETWWSLGYGGFTIFETTPSCSHFVQPF